MQRLAGILALCVLLGAGPSWAQSASNPFAGTTRWSASESWNSDKLVYTFQSNGQFRSSMWDGGKGQGTWTRNGNSLVMTWPRYDRVVYRGTIEGGEVRGSAVDRSGVSFGTFVLRLIQ